MLEAMSCGCPVVISNVGSVSEVAGDAALLFTSGNIKEAAEHLGNVISDNKIRQELVNKGLERVKLFAWENTAKKTLEVLEQIGRKL